MTIEWRGGDAGGALLRAGVWALALHLALLPFDHLAALRSLTFGAALACAAVIGWRQADRRIPLRAAFALGLAAAVASPAWTPDAAASLDAIWRDVITTFLVFSTACMLASRGAGMREVSSATATGACCVLSSRGRTRRPLPGAVPRACAFATIFADLLSNKLNMFSIRQLLWLFYAPVSLYLGWMRAGRSSAADGRADGKGDSACPA